MKKMLAVFASAALAVTALAGCGQSSSTNNQSSTTNASQDTNTTTQGSASGKSYNIAVIVKAVNNSFWQTLLQGAQKAADASNGTIHVKTYGPPAESDIEQQVSILEGVIASKPDGIVLASTSSTATVPALQQASDKNIPVALCDNQVQTSNYLSFLATNNQAAGATAADELVKVIKDQGKPLSGDVGIVSSMSGVQVLIDRDTGFTNEMKKVAPNIKLLPIVYDNDDMNQAMSATENLLTKNPNLLGIYADNNQSGDGVGQAVIERNIKGKLAVVSFDTDPTEINDLKVGAINALMVQDPWLEGYDGVEYVVDHLQGKSVPKNQQVTITTVTTQNMNDPKIKPLLYPDQRQTP